MKRLTIFFFILFSFNAYSSDYSYINISEFNKLIEETKIKNDGKAEKTIGNMFYYGNDYFRKDIKKAEEWWIQAANKGNIKAQIKLTLSYCYNELKDIDYKKGQYWLNKAFDSNNDDAYGIYASFLVYGECGFKKEENKGMQMIKKLANKGHLEASVSMAEFYLRRAHKDHIRNSNIDTYNKLAYEWGKKVAERGHPGGLYNLARAYTYGFSAEYNRKEGYKYSYMAIKSGYFGGKFLENLKKFIEINSNMSPNTKNGKLEKDPLAYETLDMIEMDANMLFYKWKIEKYDEPILIK